MIERLSSILREVGGQLLEWRAQALFAGKWEGTQFKAEADLRAHNLLVERLREWTPGIPVVSEEDPGSWDTSSAARYWIIDPLDGTASFVGGFDGFVTQAALVEGGLPVAAAVYEPARENTYSAVRGAGARINGEGLKPAGNPRGGVLIDNYPEPRGAALALFEALKFERYVECGSIGLKICRVADGTADVFFKDVLVRDWDLAAPHLVIEEAGGVLRGIEGEPLRYIGAGRHNGLIAASSPEYIGRVALWHRHYLTGRTKE